MLQFLDNLEKVLHSTQPMPALIKLGLAHARFETIHPCKLASIVPKDRDAIRLYWLRRDRWQTHFQCKDAEIVPLTAIARTTTWLLQINRGDRLQERPLWIKSDLIRFSN